MDTAAHLALIACVGSVIAAVLISLFRRSSSGTQAITCFYCLALMFAGVYSVTHNLALRQKGLGQTFGRHAIIIQMREHPVEAALSFWFSVLVGGAVSVCGAAGAVAFALPTPNEDTDAQAAQDTDDAQAAQDTDKDAQPEADEDAP